MTVIKQPFVYQPLQRVKPKILRALLKDYPDQQEAEWVIQGFTKGFPLGVDPDKRPYPRPPCENSDEANRKPDVVRELVQKEVKLGHMLGPFDEPPLPNMVYSPLHLVPKAGDVKKHRLIHNLAFPYNQESVNRCIPPEQSSVSYHYIDELIQLAMELGPNIWGCRVDFSHAFRNLPVILEDLALLGFTLDGKFYLNSSVPFGSASSCQIFERVATVLEWIVTNETAWKWISHYLDDFPMLAKKRLQLFIQIEKYMALMEHIGMPIAKEKTLGPTQWLEYLGLLLNLVNMTLQVPEEKRSKNVKRIDKLIDTFHNRKSPTVKDIQKVAGSLNFICAAIPAGRVFIADLFKLIRSKDGEQVKQSHHRRISREVYEDLLVFRTFLNEHAKPEFRSIPFLVKQQVTQESLELFADASGAKGNGFGCVFGSHWTFGSWSQTSIFQHTNPNIALLELYAIVVAVELWAKQLKGKFIVLRSDNSATVSCINSMKSEIPAAQSLLKHLAINSLLNQLFFKAVHVRGVDNGPSDLLSRGKILAFKKLCPAADPCFTQLPPALWPPKWSAQEMKPANPKNQ